MQMTPDGILEAIVEETSIPRDRLVRDATLESLGIASIDLISVIFTLEDRFGVLVETEDVKDARTLGQFIDIAMAKGDMEKGDMEKGEAT